MAVCRSLNYIHTLLYMHTPTPTVREGSQSKHTKLPISLTRHAADQLVTHSAAGLTVNTTGDLALLHSNSTAIAMMEEWSAGALIGKDDFIGFSNSDSPQPSASPSASMLVSYDAPCSPTSNPMVLSALGSRGGVSDPFGHQQQRHIVRNDQYGSEGISPSSSSYVSSSCSSLQSEDHQYQSHHSHIPHSNVLQYHQSSGQHASPSSSSIAASHIMANTSNQNMLSCFDQSPYQGSPPGYALAMSPPLFANQSNMLFSPSSGNNQSNYSSALTEESSLHLPSFTSNLIDHPHHNLNQQQLNSSRHRANDQSRHKPPTKTMKTVVVKGELSDYEDGGLLDYDLAEDYTIPPENYFQLGDEEEEEEDSAESSTQDRGAYSLANGLMPLDASGMHSSSSSSPSMSALSREMILHDKMMPLPPAKTRSKMHDLAVKHQLITNQNTRGQGSIQLSSEEKRTLLQEGYTLPTRLPLSRDEEEALKIARRKIKNKLSAQESRRKRKEYMDSLEKKVHAYFGDNVLLKNRIKQLETLNRDLLSQVKKLQNAVVDNGHGQHQL
uniref:BZIP domain-containing protein n=1 Tax=Ditylenchus dipsaci TaxID=166011 RepID=A0A915DK04_9BILA